MAFLALALATPSAADVISAHADAVSVTVYRDAPMTAQQLRETSSDDHAGLAMVAETRTVDLPAGRTRIQFQGVADEIIPASAAVQGLPGRLVERNFDYDLLGPAALIARTNGGPIRIRRTDPRTGAVSEEPATLLTGPDGVLVRTPEGVSALGCGGPETALIFDHLPEGLADRPTLSVVAEAPAAGRYTLTLTYLSVAIDWSADYVACLAPDGKTLDLTGWLTLSNRSAMSFVGAPTSVVAGRLARVAPDLPDIQPRTVSPECWPMGTTTSGLTAPPPPPPPPAPPMAMPEEAPMGAATVSEMVVAKAQPRVVATTLGDYKLYSLVEPTTLAAQETKQIRFLHQAGVRFEPLYVWRADDVEDETASAPAPATLTLSFENKVVNGLGLPIPAGRVSFRQPQDGREYYVGEQGVRDVPLDEPFELALGGATDVAVSQRVVSTATVGPSSNSRDRTALEFVVTNAKSEPVTFELRRRPDGEGFRVVAESTPHVLKNGDDVWRVALPANGSATVTYAFEVAD